MSLPDENQPGAVPEPQPVNEQPGAPESPPAYQAEPEAPPPEYPHETQPDIPPPDYPQEEGQPDIPPPEYPQEEEQPDIPPPEYPQEEQPDIPPPEYPQEGQPNIAPPDYPPEGQPHAARVEEKPQEKEKKAQPAAAAPVAAPLPAQPSYPQQSFFFSATARFAPDANTNYEPDRYRAERNINKYNCHVILAKICLDLNRKARRGNLWSVTPSDNRIALSKDNGTEITYNKQNGELSIKTSNEADAKTFLSVFDKIHQGRTPIITTNNPELMKEACSEKGITAEIRNTDAVSAKEEQQEVEIEEEQEEEQEEQEEEEEDESTPDFSKVPSGFTFRK